MKRSTILLIVLLPFSISIQAQLRGSHLLGQVGLQSATQGPPGLDLFEASTKKYPLIPMGTPDPYLPPNK